MAGRREAKAGDWFRLHQALATRTSPAQASVMCDPQNLAEVRSRAFLREEKSPSSISELQRFFARGCGCYASLGDCEGEPGGQ